MALNEHLPGGDNGEPDAGLTRVYRAAAPEEPPAHLDAAILAAARREAGARPRALPSLRAWRVPVGIAAVLVLSVSLVTLVREEGGDELYQPVRPDTARSVEPAPQPAQNAAKPPSTTEPAVEPGTPQAAPGAAPETQESGGRARGSAARQAPPPAAKPYPRPFPEAAESPGERPAPPADDPARARDAVPDRTPAAAAVMDRGSAAMSAPPPEAPASKAMRRERDGPMREDSAGQAMPEAALPAPQVAERKQAAGGLYSQQREISAEARQPKVTAIVKELDAQPPEKWLERIQALRRDGQTTEAREVLAEFKRRYPAHPLPAELQ